MSKSQEDAVKMKKSYLKMQSTMSKSQDDAKETKKCHLKMLEKTISQVKDLKTEKAKMMGEMFKMKTEISVLRSKLSGLSLKEEHRFQREIGLIEASNAVTQNWDFVTHLLVAAICIAVTVGLIGICRRWWL